MLYYIINFYYLCIQEGGKEDINITGDKSGQHYDFRLHAIYMWSIDVHHVLPAGESSHNHNRLQHTGTTAVGQILPLCIFPTCSKKFSRSTGINEESTGRTLYS